MEKFNFKHRYYDVHLRFNQLTIEEFYSIKGLDNLDNLPPITDKVNWHDRVPKTVEILLDDVEHMGISVYETNYHDVDKSKHDDYKYIIDTNFELDMRPDFPLFYMVRSELIRQLRNDVINKLL